MTFPARYTEAFGDKAMTFPARYTEAEVLEHHGIKDVWTERVITVCLHCGSITIAPDDTTHAIMAAAADGSEDWCCGPIVVYTPEAPVVAPSDLTLPAKFNGINDPITGEEI